MKKPAKRLNRAKNTIRGTFNVPKSSYLQQIHRYGASKKSPIDLMIAGLTKLDGNDAKEFMDWLVGFPLKFTRVVQIEPVHKIPKLQLADVELKMGFLPRLFFLGQVLTGSKAPIIKFLFHRTQLEEKILAGDYGLALSILDEIDVSYGHSLWCTELRVGLLQLERGLEAQKEFTAKLSVEAPGSPIAVTASWVSQRNEEGTIYARFRARLNTAMRSWRVSDGTKDAYTYLLSGDGLSSLTDEQASGVIATISSASLIDAYMVLRDAMASLPERKITIPQELIDLFSSISDASDPIAARLTSLRTGMLTEHCEPTSAEQKLFPLGANAALQLLNIAEPDIEGNNGFLTDIAKLIKLSVQREAAYDNAVDVGLKKIANFRYLDSIRILSGFVMLQADEVTVFEPSRATSLYLFSKVINPWQASVVTVALANEILEHSALSEIKTAISIALDGDVERASEFTLSKELIARKAIGDGNASFALKALKKQDEGDTISRRIIPLRVRALLMAGDLESAVEDAALLCSVSEDPGAILPLDDLVAELRAVRFNVKNKIALSLVLFAYIQGKEDRDTFQQLQFAFEDGLKSFGVEKPSALLSVANSLHRSILIAFLRDVATPSVMDVSFWLYKTSRDTLIERSSVCSALLQIDEHRSDEYAEEIKEITRIIDIEDGVEDVDRSRVFIDFARLGRWAGQELRESFERYKALTKAGIGFDNPGEFERLLKDVAAGKDVKLLDVSQYPKDEAGQLLIGVIQSVVDRYFNDEDFGLDAYLSMRVRHGSLAGHLRGPLEEAGILVARDKATKTFHVSSEWNDFAQEIVEFSTTFESVIDDLTKTRLQISSSAKPGGLFHFELQPLYIYYVRAGIFESTTLDEFLLRVHEVLDVFLNQSLQQVRNFITVDFREEVEEALTKLSDSASRSPAPSNRRDDISNAIALTSPDWQASVDRVASWFAPNKENERASLRTMEQIVDIAIQATKNCHRGFDPNLNLDIDDIGPQDPGVLVIVTDIIFTILDNVHQRSGVNSPNVLISLKVTDITDNIARVVIKVVNNVSVGAQSAQQKTRVNKIRDQIASGDYKSRIKLEGGTGFIKLKKIIAGDSRGTLDFGFTDDGFEVEVGIMIVLEPDAKADLDHD